VTVADLKTKSLSWLTALIKFDFPEALGPNKTAAGRNDCPLKLGTWLLISESS
jgi:hypothetical protein